MDAETSRVRLRAAATRLGVTTILWSLLGIVAVVIMLIEMSTSLRPLGFSLAAAATNGVQFGAVFSLIALGVALVYRSTRVINFAQGELGTVPALLVLWALLGFDITGDLDLQQVNDLQLIGYAAAAIVVGALLGMLVNVAVVQRLKNATPVTSLVATAGLTLFLTSFELIIFEARARPFPRFISGAPSGFRIGPLCVSQLDRETGQCLGGAGRLAVGGEVVPWNAVLVVLVLAGVSLALAAFFRSRAGVALLATAQEPFAAELYGVSPRAMSTLAWGAAGAFGALAGVLGAGVFTQITPGLMTATFLVPGLVGAVLGGLTSMVGAVVGGLIVGVIFALSNSVVLAMGLNSFIPGPPFMAVFLVLVVVLIVRPQGLFGKGA